MEKVVIMIVVGYYVEVVVDFEDECVIEMFMNKNFFVRCILVDIIMEKLIEK